MLLQHLLAVFIVGTAWAIYSGRTAAWLHDRTDLPGSLRLSVAWATVAALGLPAFALWFWHPVAGRVFDFAVLACFVIDTWRSRERLVRWWRTDAETRRQVALLIILGATYGGYLHLAPSEAATIDAQAANRFVAGLPIDNRLPHLLAERIAAGERPRKLHAGWLSSDRPPVQTGVILLVRPLIALSGLDVTTGAQAVGMVLQLWWVPATWGLFRWFGLSVPVTTVAVAALGCTGTPLINSLYVWPKLAAASAVITFGLLWFGERSPSPGRCVMAALCAALAWLAHGSSAFPLLAFGLLSWHRPPPSGRTLVCAVLIIIGLCGPWLLYQSLHAPPGNRLSKWHLAGVTQVDERSLGEALRDEYGALSAREILQHKTSNLRYPFHYGLSNWLHWPSPADVEHRYQVFYFLFAALGPWNLAWPLVLILGIRDHLSGSGSIQPLFAALAVAVLTFIGWGLLLFGPAATSIHQGSLALPLGLQAILIVAAWRTHPLVFAGLALWQLVIFLIVWLPPAVHTAGTISSPGTIASGLLAAGIAGALAISLQSWRSAR